MVKVERKRKLSTILAMDVVNYTAKMGANEEGTLERLAGCREIIQKVVASQQGRIFNTAGDAFMIEFASPVGAVTAAIDIQKKIAFENLSLEQNDRMEFRAGINMGDIIIEGENLFGEGVNVAARLESISPPGGICISEIIHTVVEGKITGKFVDQGSQNLKNVEKPVRAYFLEIVPGSEKTRMFKPYNRKKNTTRIIAISSVSAVFLVLGSYFFIGSDSDKSTPLRLNAIAIVPLSADSNSQDQINLANGLTQDIGGGLTQASRGLNVITLNEKPKNPNTINKDTGASYILQGSLRQSTGTLRVSINFIDAVNMTTIWSQNYDRKLVASNIFELQDEIVNSIVDQLVGNGAILAQQVAQKVSSSGTQKLSAYECVNFVRGQFFKILSPDLHAKSLICLKQAVKDDPKYAEAWQLLAQMYAWGYSLFGSVTKEELNKAEEAVDAAILIDKNFARAYATKAELSLYFQRYDDVITYGEEAVVLAPNDSATVGNISYLFDHAGYGCSSPDNLLEKYGYNREEACKRLERGFELAKIANNLDAGNIHSYDNYGLGVYFNEKRNFKKVISEFEKIPNPEFMWWNIFMGMGHHGLSNHDKAQIRFDKVRDLVGDNVMQRIEKEAKIWNMQIWVDEVRDIFANYGIK